MRAVVQRVARAAVVVAGDTVGEIGTGLLVLLGVGREDTSADAEALADKLVELRIFPDPEGKMNRSLVDVAGSILVVSQFTLLADTRKGRRPSFTHAAEPGRAAELVDHVVDLVAARGVPIATGRFGELMEVGLVNDGPVTIVLDVANGKVQ